MNAQKIIILVAYFLTALVALTTAKGYYPPDKRSNENRPFMMGMRYGRSDRAAKSTGPKQHVIVAPRNDKFFLASRYGKRSGDVAKIASFVYPVTSACGDDDLQCTYSGVSDIYRCTHRYGKGNGMNGALSTTM